MYPETFEVHDKYSPITNYPSDPVPIYDVTQVSINPAPEILSRFDKLDPIYHCFLHVFIFTYCQLSSQGLFNLIQLLCEFQGVYSQHQYDFGVVDIPFTSHLKQMPNWKKRITKVPIVYRDQMKQILDDLEKNGIIERVGLNAARNNELGSEFLYPFIILLKGDISIPRIDGKIFSTTDLSTLYHEVALTPETQKPVHFAVRKEQYK